MSYEKGGRADKFGNKFENNWVIKNLLDVILEKKAYVQLEALGEDEAGVDIWVADNHGKKEAQQCKGRNGTDDYWTYSSVNKKGLWNTWKKQLDRDENICVSLVSPLSFIPLEGICQRARTNDNNPFDFYNTQIMKSGEGIKKLFHNICSLLHFDTKTDLGLYDALKYFKRIFYRQYPDSELQQLIDDKISMIFIEDSKIVYSILLKFILTNDIYGKKITAYDLNSYLIKNNIHYRSFANDTRITPIIKNLNMEYDDAFNSFSKELLLRNESSHCWNLIQQGKSIIIHGQAGAGKSGVTANIIDFCKNESVPYLAIKLDKRVPTDNTKDWSKSLGFPDSLSYCFDSISKDKHAVVILDQLDALRWTLSDSATAITVCTQLVREINALNNERENKISLVLVCRSYDLQIDPEIKKILIDNINWEECKVELLENQDVKKIIGSSFNNLSHKMCNLLRVPSNLYIWTKLDNTQNIENIEATYQLVFKWKEQLAKKAKTNHIDIKLINDIINQIVSFCAEKGKLSVPLAFLDIDELTKTFLMSNGLINQSGNKISFTHQSILDCFLAKQMLIKYYNNEPLIDIIGSLEQQKTSRRYQTQIFFQQLLDSDNEMFLNLGSQLLNNSNIRYNFKCLFLEVVAQIQNPDDSTIEFVIELLSNAEWKKPVINAVINGKSIYITHLIEDGILDLWMKDTPEIVISLLASLSPNYDKKLVKFMRKYCLSDKSNPNWSRCFYGNITEDSDDFFDLKLEYYKMNPEMFNYLIFSRDFFEKPIRAIRFISLMLPLELKNNQDNSVYNGVKNSLLVHSDTFTNNYLDVLKILCPCLPTIDECSNKSEFNISDWTNNYFKKSTIKRACILIIKAATRACAKADPDKFLELYRSYMGNGYELFNEIILDGMIELGDEYADFVLNYLQEDITKNCFERSSEHRNELYYTKKLVQKYSKACKDDTLTNFEDKIMRYVPVNQKEKLKKHYKSAKKNTNDQTEDQIKDDKEHTKYYPIWGHFQYEILKSIDSDKLSDEANNLLQVLDRNLSKSYMPYDHSADSQSGSVISPVTNKEISAKAWMKILLNNRLEKEGKSVWSDDQNCFICNSLGDFCRRFQSYVANNPNEITELLLIENNRIQNYEFLESFFFGLSLSNKLIDISSEQIEKLMKKFYIDTPTFYESICRIIEINPDKQWSKYMVNCVKDVATNHAVLKVDDSILTESNPDFFSIETKALNCTRGTAIRTISQLLWVNHKYYSVFKDCIAELANDHNPVIRYATLYALYPIYNIDREWAMDKIMKIFNENNLMIGFPNTRKLFNCCYSEYKITINQIIRNAMNSDDHRILETCGYSIAELHILHDQFNDIFNIYQNNPKLQNSISTMLMIYLNNEKYREKSKQLLLQILNSDKTLNEEWIWRNLLNENILDAKKDGDMINMIPSEHLQPETFRDFSEYACKQKDIKCLADVIFETSEKMLKKDMSNPETRYIISTCLSRLISTLYDAVYSSNLKTDKTIANKCLDLWDEIYKIDFNIGSKLTNVIMSI